MKSILFSKQEKFGMLIFWAILMLVLISRLSQNIIVSKESWREEISLVPVTLDSSSLNTNRDSINNSSNQLNSALLNIDFEWEKFNPNTIGRDSLVKMGFKKRVIDNLIKYRDKGGKFFSPGDLLKVYGMDTAKFQEVKKYISIPKVRYQKKAKSYSWKKDSIYKAATKVLSIDMNKANEEELMQLKGIGPVLAKRIIKYRNSLGGFSDKRQIKEVYGIMDSVYLGIEDQLILEDKIDNKLNINKISFKELLKHPYTDYEMTKLIINYRENHGSFENEDALRKIYMLDQQKLLSLLPYLDYSIAINIKQDSTILEK